jgi:Protein of unknown function (DUF3467)
VNAAARPEGSAQPPEGSAQPPEGFAQPPEGFAQPRPRSSILGPHGGMVRRMSDDPNAPKLQVQLDDDVSQGVYTNLVLINHTENEFVLDFAFIQPGNARAKVRSRLISSPRHTKRLLVALQKNIERFEERFGAIDIGTVEDEGPILH